jgi:hypothetical protein
MKLTHQEPSYEIWGSDDDLFIANLMTLYVTRPVLCQSAECKGVGILVCEAVLLYR